MRATSAENVSDPIFLPFARPTIDEAMVAAVADTLRSRWLATGPAVRCAA
jgi:dTDP-4-amino-4,6-dideoxygalactose transaminase